MPETKASRTLAAWCLRHSQAALIARIEARAGVRISHTTASRWCGGLRLPSPRYVTLLADELGIPPQHWYLAP